MNTDAGVAVETSVELAGKWTQEKKGGPKGKAIALSGSGNFREKTLGIIRYVMVILMACWQRKALAPYFVKGHNRPR